MGRIGAHPRMIDESREGSITSDSSPSDWEEMTSYVVSKEDN